MRIIRTIKRNKRRSILNKDKLIKGITASALAFGLAFSFCLPAAAASPRVDFIDVSHYQGIHGLPLSFYQTIKQGGVNGVVVKVSEGTTYLDPAASVNIANASQAGLVVNAYHFARFGTTSAAKSEADYFDKQLRYVGFDKLKDGIVVVDVEVREASRSQQTGAVNAFISEMNQLGYPTVDVYSGSYFYNNYLDPSKLSVKDPWLAAYPYNPQHDQPTAHFVYTKGAWQWASDYHFGGIGGRFDVSEDYAGKYSDTLMAPNATQPGTPKKIHSLSLLDYMRTHKTGYGYGWAAQVKLASAYGVSNYVGSASQNLALLAKLQNGVKPAPKPVYKAPTKKPASKELSYGTYIVRSGDTLYEIGIAHHISYQTIMKLNGLHSWLIHPGQKLKLSGSVVTKKAPAVSVHTYTVHRGDTLWAIAQGHKTTVSHLTSLNHLHSSLIYPGQKIKY